MSTTESHVLSVKMSPDLRGKLASLAAQHDRSVSAEVREAIRLHLRLSDVGGVPSSYPSGGLPEPPPEGGSVA